MSDDRRTITSDGKYAITFDPKEPLDCARAVCDLAGAIMNFHGPTVTYFLFSAFATKRKLQELKNWELLREAERIGSTKKATRLMAEQNKVLSEFYRWGPGGSTDPEILERQIKRLKKKKRRDISK